MKKSTATSIVLATLAVAMQNVYANTKVNELQQDNNNIQLQAQSTSQKTWLGVTLSSVPDVLFKQLSDVIPENQGILVQSVVAGSPAAIAGLQDYDVLLSFNDQQLYSGKQLSGLVASDKLDNEVTLTVIRNGVKLDINVKLGVHTVTLNPLKRPQTMPDFWSRHFTMPNFGQPLLSPAPILPQGKAPSISPAPGQGSVLQQFESVQIKSLDSDRYLAEVEYQENNGDKKKFTFEGKYDEIRQQIESNNDLPESKKQSLLNALSNKPDHRISGGDMNFPHMQAFPAMPSFDSFFNNAPHWFGHRNNL